MHYRLKVQRIRRRTQDLDKTRYEGSDKGDENHTCMCTLIIYMFTCRKMNSNHDKKGCIASGELMSPDYEDLAMGRKCSSLETELKYEYFALQGEVIFSIPAISFLRRKSEELTLRLNQFCLKFADQKGATGCGDISRSYDMPWVGQ